MKKLLYLFFFMGLSSSMIAQSTIYSETFTGQNGKGVIGGTTLVFDTTGVSWSVQPTAAGLTASSDWFQVLNEVFEGRDVDENQVWISDTIDISSFSNLTLSLDVSESGTMEGDDYLDVEYSVDNGQTFTLIANYNGKGSTSHTLIDDFSSESISQSIPNGSALILKISMDNNSSSEYTRFDNVQVTGFAAGSLVGTISAQTNVSCNRGNDGSLTASASSGTAPYTFAWSNGSTQQSATNLAAGTYTVTVLDAQGATVTASSAITEPQAMLLSLTIDQDVSCNGGNDGSISVATSGGTAPYTYAWSNGMSGTLANNLSAGSYSVTVTDANGCTQTNHLSLTAPQLLQLSTDNLTNPNCLGIPGAIGVKASGGTGDLTFAWSTGSTEVASSNLVFQSFEGNTSDTWNYTINPSTYNTSGDVWAAVSSLSSINPNDQYNFWGMSDLENGNGGGAFYHTISFDPIDVSNVSNGSVNFDYHTLGFDSSDEIEYEVVFDNDTIWSANGTTLNKNTTAWTTVSTPIPIGTQYVRLRIQAKQNGSDYAGIDNVSISQPVDTSYSSIKNLTAGTYSVTVSDENGCFSNDILTLNDDLSPCRPPQKLLTYYIQDTSAILVWDTVASADYYRIGIKEKGQSNWSTFYFKQFNQGWLPIDGLKPNTIYFWSVRANIGGTWTNFARQARFVTTSAPCVIPKGLSSGPVLDVHAKLNWSLEPNSINYRIRYRIQGHANWNSVVSHNNRNFQWLSNLTRDTIYEWQIKSVCQFGISTGTRWSPVQTFRTKQSQNYNPSLRRKLYHQGLKIDTEQNALSIFPNPTKDVLKIQGLSERTEIMIFDQVGRTVLRTYVDPNQNIEMGHLENGLYFIKVLNQDELILKVIKH